MARGGKLVGRWLSSWFAVRGFGGGCCGGNAYTVGVTEIVAGPVRATFTAVTAGRLACAFAAGRLACAWVTCGWAADILTVGLWFEDGEGGVSDGYRWGTRRCETYILRSFRCSR